MWEIIYFLTKFVITICKIYSIIIVLHYIRLYVLICTCITPVYFLNALKSAVIGIYVEPLFGNAP